MRVRLMTGILVLLVGLVFIGQGLGILRSSSFMVDEPFWAVVGAVCVVVGLVLAVITWRDSRTGA